MCAQNMLGFLVPRSSYAKEVWRSSKLPMLVCLRLRYSFFLWYDCVASEFSSRCLLIFSICFSHLKVTLVCLYMACATLAVRLDVKLRPWSGEGELLFSERSFSAIMPPFSAFGDSS